MLRESGLLHSSVDRLTGKFKLLLGGAAAAWAGTAALRGMWHLVEAAKDLNKELNRTRQLGGEFAATVAQARMTAFRTWFSVPTTTPDQNVRVQRELATQLQNPQAAADILPLAQRTAYVISNYTGENVEDIVKNLAKVADLRAQIFSRGPDGQEHVDAAKVMTEFNGAMRALLLAGGFVKSNDLVQMARQAGVPAKGMTPEAFYAAMAEMAVSQGAARAGTAVTSLYQQLVGGTMTQRTAEEMERMGLFHPGDFSVRKGGHVVVSRSAEERLQREVGPDPIGYITGPLNDLMTAKGMSQQDKLLEVFRLFGRQTTQRLVAEALSAEPQFARARSMFGTIPNVDSQYQMLQSQDLDTNIKSFEAAWKGLMQALGEQGIPVAIGILHQLTDALHAMTAWTVAHPDAAAALFKVAAGLSALTALSGSLVLFAFFLGPLATALRVLVGIGGLVGLTMRIGALGFAISRMTGITGLVGLAWNLGVLALSLARLAAVSGLNAAAVGVNAVAGALGRLAGISLFGVAAGLGAIAAAAGVIGFALKLGSDNETPERRQQRENLERQRRAPTRLTVWSRRTATGWRGVRASTAVILRQRVGAR